MNQKNNNNYTLKNTIDNNSVLQHNNYTMKIKFTRKIGKGNHANDCIQFDKKRNRKLTTNETKKRTMIKDHMNHRSNNNNSIPISLNLTSVDKKEVNNNTMPPKGTILTSRNDVNHQKVVSVLL